MIEIDCICGVKFMPRALGFNAKYCSKKCKNRAARLKLRPSQKIENRKRSYLSIKNDPDRYGKHLSSCKNSRDIVRKWLAEYKISRGCKDCGYKHHSAALQLDHEGKKTANISDLRTSKERILKEIESGKCVVRCAICHSVKTWAEKNGIKYVPGMAFKGDL